MRREVHGAYQLRVARGKGLYFSELQVFTGEGFDGTTVPIVLNPVAAYAHAVSGGKRAELLQSGNRRTSVLVILPMKVLIAEDDQDSRELLSWLLQKMGYQVVAMENGRDAWEAYRKGQYRVVISDLLMPDIDGLELCRRIRAHAQSNYTYIILLTALIGNGGRR